MDKFETDLPGVFLIAPTVHSDERGFFLESWNERQFIEAGIPGCFVQDNHSRSNRGVLRGLHYQINRPQGKLVRVIQGKVWDVVVDITASSPTFKTWAAFELSEENRHMLWIPKGYAHGFIALEDNTDLVYKCSDYFIPEYDRSLRWDDPQLAIDWPQIGTSPVISKKDAAAPFLSDADLYN